jgi:hypothetical protein
MTEFDIQLNATVVGGGKAMKKLSRLCFYLAAGLLFFGCSRPETQKPQVSASKARRTETIDLFNGKDLDGWKAYLVDSTVAMEEVWSVEDRILVCRGEPLGYLFTEGKYSSFDLVVEWRWAPGKEPGNSGVLMRISGEPRAIPRAIEVQLKSGDAGDLYSFHGMKISADPGRTTFTPGHELLGDFVGVAKIESNEKEPGQWNHYQISLDGPNLTAWINGKKVNEAFDCDVLEGPLGLQSEGGEIHFRTVRMTLSRK